MNFAELDLPSRSGVGSSRLRIDSGNRCQQVPLTRDRDTAFEAWPEAVRVRRQSQAGRPMRPSPGTSRIQDDGDVAFGQSLNAADECSRPAQTDAFGVDGVTGQQHTVGLVSEAGINHSLEGYKRGVFDDPPDFSVDRPGAAQWLIERNSGRMDAAKGFHLGKGSA
jgi:hypothetical protein